MPRDADGFEGPGDEMAVPELAEPCYECEISLPDGAQIEFSEFDLEGKACRARRVEFGEFDLGGVLLGVIAAGVAGPGSGGVGSLALGGGVVEAEGFGDDGGGCAGDGQPGAAVRSGRL